MGDFNFLLDDFLYSKIYKSSRQYANNKWH